MSEKHDDDIIDTDLYEELDPETMLKLIEEEKAKTRKEEKAEAKKRPFPRWLFWIIAGTLILNVVAIIPQTFSIPAIDFLITSARLSANDEIQTYKEAVVVVETRNSKGTGFAISDDGYIITNHHVIEGNEHVTIAFPNEGLFEGKVVESDESVDLALIKVDENNLPYLTLQENTEQANDEDKAVTFIGNPLRFNGIANEGKIIGETNQTRLSTEVYLLDAPVYRGNSGSPIINSVGEVIAVIYATLNHEEYGRVGLAVPIERFYEYLDYE